MTQQRLKIAPGDRTPLRPVATPEFEALNTPPIGKEESVLREILVTARRWWRGLTLWFCLCIGAGIAYALLATPEYVATSQIVLEPAQPAVPMDSAAWSMVSTLDSRQADTQAQVIQSERNLRYVFNTLELAKDPEFAGKGAGPLAWLKPPFSVRPETTSSADELARQAETAFRRFADRVTVKRVGQSYVLEISFRALSPDKAAHLANSITAAYVRDEIKYNVAATTAQRGGEYLQNRISDAKTEQDVADNSVKTGVIPDYTFGHANARIISAATEPLGKSYPMTRGIMALAAVIALITGFGAIVVHNEVDRTARSREQVRRLTGIDVLAVVPPFAKGSPALCLRKVLDEPGSSFAQAIRALRTLVQTSNGSSRPASVGLVSCNPCEGRSTVAANIAYLIAGSGRPVTLLDADLRNPGLTKALAPEAVRSLAELALSHGADLKALRQPIDSTLSFIPAVSIGSDRSPNLFLGSREMLQGIHDLATAETVVVDLPPLSSSAEAIAFGKSLTGVIVVAALYRTSVEDLASAVRTFSRFGVRVLGVVLNDIPRV